MTDATQEIAQAQATPPGEKTEPAAPQFVCPECGEICRNSRHLGVHRRFKHGVPGKSAARNKAQQQRGKAQRGQPGKQPAPTEAPQIAPAFDAIVSLMQVNADVVGQCLEGLDRLLGEAKKLRKGYIKNADRLRKLHADIGELHSGD